jgi:DNA-binding CsgD family transcriptional regulator
MAISLQSLFSAVSQVATEAELRSHLAPQLGAYFAAQRQGIFFFDQMPLVDRRVQAALQAGLSVQHNPVVRYLVERHAPVHEGLVTTPQVWQMICPRADHWHVMAGPIVSQGRLVGAVGCTRDRSRPAFDAQNLSDLSAICLHLSVWAATQRNAPTGSPESSQASLHPTAAAESLLPQTGLWPLANASAKFAARPHPLTPRELQIAELVALGQTNAQIGRQLWITENSVKQALKRMFRKLEVSSRAEMVAQLVTTQQTPN